MKIGELAECAIWIDGTESDAHLAQWKADASYLMQRSHGEPLLVLGPVSFKILKPGQERVPQVPEHISGPDVRLLVAEAEVIGHQTVKTSSFLNELSERDLQRLRAVTRKGRTLTDAQCDAIIEQFGPLAAATMH